MTNARISELEHSAWSMFSFMGRGPGGRIVDTPSRLVIETPVDRPPYNAVLRFHDEGDRPLRDQAEALLKPMLERGVTPIWLVHPTTDPAITDALVEIGLDCTEELFGMAADLADIPPSGHVPDGVEVVELTLDSSNKWLELVSWRYGLGEESSEYLIEAYRSTLDERTRVWVAMVDGQAVSKVGVHIDHLVNPAGVAGIYGVATTESGRNRGLRDSCAPQRSQRPVTLGSSGRCCTPPRWPARRTSGWATRTWRRSRSGPHPTLCTSDRSPSLARST